MLELLPISELNPVHVFPLVYRNWQLRFEVGPGDRLALFANDCLRKERIGEAAEVLYVWTNLELEWEEHHWLEARLLAAQPTQPGADTRCRTLRVTVNGEPLMQVDIAAT